MQFGGTFQLKASDAGRHRQLRTLGGGGVGAVVQAHQGQAAVAVLQLHRLELEGQQASPDKVGEVLELKCSTRACEKGGGEGGAPGQVQL